MSLTTAEMAAEMGVDPVTLRSAASRALRADPTVEIGRTRDGTGRSDRWDPEVTRAWWASRPGRWPARTRGTSDHD